ncbi:hypothetical protein ES703_50634 [subsurface metagenome]
MIRVGQKIDGWEIVDIDYPVGSETWVHPKGWVLAMLMDPDEEIVMLPLSPKDQTLGRVQALLDEELASRKPWIGKELTL